MIKYERIDVSEGIDLSKTSTSKECMICRYCYILDIGYKYEPHACNKCHDILMIPYELENIAILNVKGVDYRCVLWNMTKNDAIKLFNNSRLDNKGVIMDFGANITLVEVIK